MKYTIDIINRRPERIKRAHLIVECAGITELVFEKEYDWHMNFNEVAADMLSRYINNEAWGVAR